MAVPETLLRDRIRTVIEEEFEDEEYTVADDKLTRAAGRDGAAELACYPEPTEEMPGNASVLDLEAVLQLYLPYEAEPDETIVVDPGVIETHADRIRRAFAGTANVGTTADFWYVRVARIEYPDDPTGNKSRLEAHFVARCDNPAV